MGMLDGLLGLLSGSQAKQQPQQPQQQEPATAPVSSAPVQAQVPQQPVSPEQQQAVQSAEAMSSNAKMITDIIAPAIVTLAGNEEGEQRAKHVAASTAVLTDQAARETARVYDNLEKQRGAQEGLVDAQQLSQLMQLDQIEASDARAMEANQLFREQIAPINDAISEDTRDIGEARALQNSGNPISWVWGKLKEEYNNETLAEAQAHRVNLQQSAQVNFALNTAERALTSKQMAAAGKREIIAGSLVKKLQANESISAKEIDFIAKQLDLNHKEVGDIMAGLNYDLNKQQLTIQRAHLVLAQAQEKRQREAFDKQIAQYGDAEQAAKDTFKQLKDLNLADKPGTSWAQVKKAMTNPSSADVLTINAITTALGGANLGGLYNETGLSNFKYADVANNPTLVSTHPELVEIKNATDTYMQKWETTAEGRQASAEQREAKRDEYFNQAASTTAQDAQQYLDNDKITIPTLSKLAETNQNLQVYNQKAFDVLKTLQTTIKTPNDNNNYFENVVDAAEKNGVGLDVMANQLSTNFRFIAAESYRSGAIITKPSKFVVGLSDNYTGSYNILSGTFGKRAGAVDLLSPKDIHNILASVSKRRKVAVEMQNARTNAVRASNYQYYSAQGYSADIMNNRSGYPKTEY